jgi:hypothetical protein
MNSDKERLIHDLMKDSGSETRRAETLRAGGQVMRRRRHVRHARWTLGVLSIAALVTLWIQRPTAPKLTVATHATMGSSSASATAQIHRLTDDELLAMFPDVPVGLATLPDGRKRLIFPRPGDEARFIRHL